MDTICCCCEDNEANKYVQFDDTPVTRQPTPSYQQTQSQSEHHQREIHTLKESIRRKDTEIVQLKHANEELRLRLSTCMSARITDSNPNIADLSDANRPTNLGDQYSELYDNQWTEAFDELKYKGETETVRIILELFVAIYSECQRIASEQLNEMTSLASRFVGNDQSRREILKRLKDERKKNYKKQIKDLTPSVTKAIETKEGSHQADAFVRESIRLCWLMVVQDPPVVIDASVDKHGEQVDTSAYKHYTKTGDMVDYVVWPALRLHEKGAILMKGVVQPLDQECL